MSENTFSSPPRRSRFKLFTLLAVLTFLISMLPWRFVSESNAQEVPSTTDQIPAERVLRPTPALPTSTSQIPNFGYFVPTRDVTHSDEIVGLVNEMIDAEPGVRDRKEDFAKLREHLEKEFDSNHIAQALMIKKAATTLKALSALHETRSKNKEKIIQYRIEQLLGPDETLRWNSRSLPTQSFQTPLAPINSFQSLATPGANAWSSKNQQSGSYYPNTGNPIPPAFNQQAPTPIAPFSSLAPPQPPAPAPSKLSNAFALMRRIASDSEALKLALSHYESVKKLRETGALPALELQKAELEVRKLKRTLEVDKYNLDFEERSITDEKLRKEFKDAKAKLLH